MAEVDYTLPSPTDTPYRTPSSTRSARSHPYDTMSPSSSPPPMPSDDRPMKRRSQDSTHSNPALDENISPLDPRRFTPTLHASLVSEILSLRRDLEGKTKDIDRLEDSLHNAQSENETLNDTLATNSKESRSLKRQLQLLEGGTMSALGDIAKERDEALNDVADLRRRLDQSQKRAKSHEDHADRTQSLWDRDRDNWSNERRALETKVNIVEGRLKVVLSEVAHYHQHTTPQHPDHLRQHRGSFSESPSKRSTSALSHRRQSVTSTGSDNVGGRLSALGYVNGHGTFLADELALDEEEEYHDGMNEDGRASPDALPEERERPMSSLSTKAHRILGLDTVIDGRDVIEETDRQRSASRLSIRTPMPEELRDSPQLSLPHSPVRIPLAVSAIMQTEILPVEPLPVIEERPFSRSTGMEPASPISLADSVGSHDAPWNKALTTPQTIMVSISCQTIELLPSPPLTPESPSAVFSSTEVEPLEKVEMKTIATQTETFDVPKQSNTAKMFVEDVRKLPIPTIAIIPPGSRPATPETAVVLPPRTKNAGCQVDLQSPADYSSTGMQTDEIILHRRILDLPPLTTSNAVSQYRSSSSAKGVPPNSSRRRFYQGMPTPPMEESQRHNAGSSRWGPDNDAGPLRRDIASNISRPVRSSSLFAGFEDAERENEFGQVHDDDFDDDEFFSRPTAKFTIKSGKMVSLDSPLEDVDELAAADAGEAVALGNLRMSEDSLPSEFRTSLSGRSSPRKRSAPYSFKQLRRVPSPKRYNIRKAALISSGTAAHSAQSSVRSSTDMASLASENPPPFPVPIRFSSARIGKSLSEGGRSSPASSGASPTRRDKHRHRKPMLRKTRSGPAISPQPNGRRQRSQSPPLDSRVSIVPEMPTFRMPVDNVSVRSYTYQPVAEGSAPRPSVATGPHRKTSHMKTNSDAVSMHSTSVVDAIAQTMVGEWMFKYVRRRKSFGMPDSRANEYDPNKNADEISASVTSTGVRHKRWVWLAPYERSVMWSSKQPTSNSALLGKSGRKLTIQSVLDVKDDNPMPKGAITGPHFNRSILILTPQRALKFTALNQERHYVWLTALSFLSHSPLSLTDLAALPGPPTSDEPHSLPPPSLAGSLRRRPIRDSIRIAKGAGRQGLRSFTTDGSLPVQDVIDRDPRMIIDEQGYYDPMTDAALPPSVPRFHAHSRKRSNTAPRVPPSSYKTYGAMREQLPSVPANSAYSQSVATTGNGSDRGLYTPSLGVRSVGSKSSSRRGSEASAVSRPNVPVMMNGGYDGTSVTGGISSTGTRSGTLVSNTGASDKGTMRMDAFIETRTPPPLLPNVPQKSGFAAKFGIRGKQHQQRREQLSGTWMMEEGRSPPMQEGVEDILAGGDGIYGSTRGMMMHHHQQQHQHHGMREVEVGGSGDPFRGF